MATHLKKTQQGLVAEAKWVAATARKYFEGFRGVDEGRKRKLLPESRLLAFEAAIAQLEGAIGGRRVASNKQVGATQAEGQRRSRLYDVLRELREEVKLGLPEERGVGRAFGVGTRMSRNSTPRVLRVARGVLASWAQEGFREAVMEIGITGARMASVRVLTEGLEKAQTDQDGMCGVARGKTILKGAQLEKVQREVVYVRRAARFVFRKQPAVLAEFAGTMRGKRRRGARSGAGEGEGSGSLAGGPRRAARRRRGGAGRPQGAAQAQRGEGEERQGQDGSSSRQDGSSRRQVSPSAGQGRSSLRQVGSSARQEGSSRRQDDSFLRQEGSFSRTDGPSSRGRAASRTVGGAAPRKRRRRRG